MCSVFSTIIIERSQGKTQDEVRSPIAVRRTEMRLYSSVVQPEMARRPQHTENPETSDVVRQLLIDPSKLSYMHNGRMSLRRSYCGPCTVIIKFYDHFIKFFF